MNPVLLQKQLKDNATDLQDFYKELKSWGEEMKRKEDTLKEDSSKKVKKNNTKTHKTKDSHTKNQNKIGTTDYSKWEKYDAELECEHLEDDFKDDSELTDEFEDGSRDEAIAYKEKGNSFVKMKEWDKAIDCYTKAINCYAYDPIYYANRALCYLKKNSFISAEEDCTLSLRLDSTYVKALQRRAAARENLGKLDLALADLELVLTHEPHNKDSKSALDRVKKKLAPIEKPAEVPNRPVSQFTASRTKNQPEKSAVVNTISKIPSSDHHTSPSNASWPDVGCEIINVKSIIKPPHLRSSKALTRIKIKEINSLSQQSILAPTETEAVKKHVIEHVKEIQSQDLAGGGEPAIKTSAFKKTRDRTKDEKDEPARKNAWPNQQRGTDIIKSDDLSVLERKELPKSNPKDTKNTENILITQMSQRVAPENKIPVAQCNQEFTVPKTSVQFYSTWKTLKSLDSKYNYLKLLKPQELPKIFKESLDSTVFTTILEVLSSSFVSNNDDVYDFLYNLTQVSRFSALIMFMDPPDKDHLWKIMTYLREKGHKSEEVEKLIKKYEL